MIGELGRLKTSILSVEFVSVYHYTILKESTHAASSTPRLEEILLITAMKLLPVTGASLLMTD